MLFPNKIYLALLPCISLVVINIKGGHSEASSDIQQISWHKPAVVPTGTSEQTQQSIWETNTTNITNRGSEEEEQITWVVGENEARREHQKRTWSDDEGDQILTWTDNSSKGSEEDQQITWGRPNTDTAHFDYDNPDNVTVMVGQRALLPCSVINLDKKDVSWIRQRDLHILTVGIFTYTTDDRFKVFHPENSNQWSLEINPVTFRDEGVYECQVSTSPKIFLPILLNVELQQAKISGPSEVFIQNSSTIRLFCTINTHSDNVGSVRWYRNMSRIDYDSPRGGVSIEIEKTPVKTTSKLFLTRAGRNDSGNYTCAPEFADAAAVMVHVVNGEESAAVHTASSVVLRVDVILVLSCLFTLLYLDLEPR